MGRVRHTDLQIEYLPIERIKPYKGNANKHNKKSIAAIKASITDFGMCDPIGIWGNDNLIVEGHGRLEALKELGYTTAPVIRLDHLTDEQRRAYTLAHNKTAEFSTWDMKMLDKELDEILDIDMRELGLEKRDDSGYYGDERERTYNAYNMHMLADMEFGNDFWEMPCLKAEAYIPPKLIRFSDANVKKEYASGVHFYLDDYKFERIWNSPDKYFDLLSRYSCILSPDFSMYLDMPMPMKIWNSYRSKAIGAYYQSCGLRVIPSIGWAEPETYDFAFAGMPKNSTVAVSSVGCRNPESLKCFKDGLTETIRRLEPTTILMYGGEIDFDYGGIPVIYYENEAYDKRKR